MRQNDFFLDSVSPNNLNNKKEIRILICYILNKINIPVKKSDVILALQSKGIANYFDLSEAFFELISDKILIESKDFLDKFTITDQGKLMAQELEKSIPKTIRDESVQAVKLYLEQIRNENENNVIIKQNNYGFSVICSISDGDFNMLKLELYAPDINTANNIKNKFYKNPSEIYNKILCIFNNLNG